MRGGAPHSRPHGCYLRVGAGRVLEHALFALIVLHAEDEAALIADVLTFKGQSLTHNRERNTRLNSRQSSVPEQDSCHQWLC